MKKIPAKELFKKYNFDLYPGISGYFKDFLFGWIFVINPFLNINNNFDLGTIGVFFGNSQASIWSFSVGTGKVTFMHKCLGL